MSDAGPAAAPIVNGAGDIDVVIVGGGIAGLATAFELAKRNVRFVLLEAAPRPGGVIRTEEADGFTIDTGPDSLLAQKPAAIQLCEELGLGPRLYPTSRPRTAFILRGGHLHPLPEASVLGIPTRLAPLAASSLFSLSGKARMAMDLVIPARSVAEPADESIASFIGRRFGREAVTYLAEPLLAGIHAGDVDRLSMHALFPRLVAAEQRHGSLIRAFRSARPSGAGKGAFHTLPGGLAELVEALTRTLPEGALACNRQVVTLEGGRPFTVRTVAGDSFRANHVVMATPAYITARLVARLDPTLGELCAAIPYESTVTVFLAYPRDAVAHPLQGSGFVVPRAEGDTSLLAASWVSSKWAHRAPSNMVLLRGFLGGARDQDAIERDDRDLLQSCRAPLEHLLGISGPPRLVRLYRWPRATAQHEVGHLARLAAIDERLTRQPDLHMTGSGFRGTGIPDCVADGRRIAAQVAAITDRARAHGGPRSE